MNKQLLKEAVLNTPILSLKVPLNYTKAIREAPGRPMILRQAQGFQYTLEDLPIIIREDELIVGTFDEDIPVAIPRPESSGLRILKELDMLPQRLVNPVRVREKDKKTFKEELAPYWDNFRIETYAHEIAPSEVFEGFFSGGAYVPTEVGGIAHAVLSYPRLLSKGLKAYISIAKEKIEYYKDLLGKLPGADKKISFYKSIKIVGQALIDFALRYSKKAKEMAEAETDKIRKLELETISEVCKNVPANPAKNFYEAIQFIWFIHMAVHIENFEHGISFGRLDQYLKKYYIKDSQLAIRLLKNLFLKTNEIIALYDSIATQYFGGMATTQNVLIGGIDSEGNDATNELTYLILDAFEEIGVPSPNVVVRCHESTPSALYKRIANFLANGKNLLGLYNDKVVIEALMKYGIPLEEARNYGVVGCVGLSTSGTSFDNTGAIFLSLPKALECSLGIDKTIIHKIIENHHMPNRYNSIDDLITSFEECLRSIMELSIKAGNAFQQAHRELKPAPLMSLCIDGCFEKGKDVNKGPAKYNFSGIHTTGFSDVVDSLAAIDKAVFKEKKFTMNELIKALKKNFRKNEIMKQYLEKKCPKYGSDNENVDRIAKRVAQSIRNAVKGFKCDRGDDYRVGIHAMTTHVGFGVFTNALPSGRKKGEPLTKDIAPGNSSEKGLTAVIKSITKIDHSLFGNGLACTLNINPEIARIEDGNIIESLLRTYFKLGGSHIQFNAISPTKLKKAQENPNKYKNLMVRVSGYSARFIDLPKGVQDDIISRYCYGNV
ncbi:MAG: formate C-acetyltransferase/glycerol dehydratase family glycyl radical enzyme [Promethearchaeati archaeon]